MLAEEIDWTEGPFHVTTPSQLGEWLGVSLSQSAERYWEPVRPDVAAFAVYLVDAPIIPFYASPLHGEALGALLQRAAGPGQGIGAGAGALAGYVAGGDTALLGLGDGTAWQPLAGRRADLARQAHMGGGPCAIRWYRIQG
jgi:hypothetical protein